MKEPKRLMLFRIQQLYNQLINVGINHFDDKTMITRIRIMNSILFFGFMISLINAFIGILVQDATYIFSNLNACILIIGSFFLIHKGKYKVGWYLILTIPALIITAHPFFTDTVFTALIYYFVFQTLVFALFDKGKLLYAFFMFYSVNAILFLYFGYKFSLDGSINHDFMLSSVNLFFGLTFQFFALRFVQYIRRQQQIEIHFSIAKFQSLFENSPIGIIVTSRAGDEPKLINGRAGAIFGFDLDIFKHKSISAFTHPEDRNKHDGLYQELLENKRSFFDIEKRYIHAEGHTIWCRTAIALIRDKEGKVTHTVAMLQDITKYKEQEIKIHQLLDRLQYLNSELEQTVDERTRHLIKTNEELIRSNQDLEQFAYAASHDLQEPLRMVGNFVQLLERKYSNQLDDNGKTYIGFAVEGVTRMSKLIKNLLQYSRIGKNEVALRPVDVQTVIEHKLLDLEQLMKEKDATVEINALPKKIVCEPVQLGLVFYNLVVNGLKFNRNKNPRIKISAKELEEHWCFRVEDNGIGIEAEYEEKIFDLFKRLNRRDEFEGTGMGLSICKKIVFRHKGKIWFDSALGEGTTFYFTIAKDLTNDE